MVKDNLHHDPKSAIGISLAKQCMDLINNLYGKENAHLRTTKWEKGFKEGKGLEDYGLTFEIVHWLDKAIDAYWYQRLYEVLAKAGKLPSSELLASWNQLLEEMYGNASQTKVTIYDTLIHDEQVSKEAKEWLKKISN